MTFIKIWDEINLELEVSTTGNLPNKSIGSFIKVISNMLWVQMKHIYFCRKFVEEAEVVLLEKKSFYHLYKLKIYQLSSSQIHAIKQSERVVDKIRDNFSSILESVSLGLFNYLVDWPKLCLESEEYAWLLFWLGMVFWDKGLRAF